jgi:hypothetical protein
VSSLIALSLLIHTSVAAAPPAGGANEKVVDKTRIQALMDQVGDDLLRVETDHYVVLYDGGSIFAKSRARIAERTAESFHETFAALGVTLRPIETKLLMLVFRDKKRYVGYAERVGYDAEKIDAFYTIEDDVVVLFDSQTDGDYRKLARLIDASRANMAQVRDQLRRIKDRNAVVELRVEGRPPQTMTRRQLAHRLSRDTRTLESNERALTRLAGRENASKTRHEAAHQLAIHTGVQPKSYFNPFWLTEGLACQFEIRLSASARERDAFPRDRLEGFRVSRQGAHFRPLAELLTASMSTDMAEEELLSLYSQAWALFYYLRVKRPEPLASYLASLTAKPHTADTTAAERVRRFQTHFTEDLERIDREYIAYVESLR